MTEVECRTVVADRLTLIAALLVALVVVVGFGFGCVAREVDRIRAPHFPGTITVKSRDYSGRDVPFPVTIIERDDDAE